MLPLIKLGIESGSGFTFYPRGSSMLPFIRQSKDAVVLVKADELKPLDIILYQRERGTFVLHRIIKETNGSFTVCGDNQGICEKGIKKSQIIAKVSKILVDGKNEIDVNSHQYLQKVKAHMRKRPLRAMKQRIDQAFKKLKIK